MKKKKDNEISIRSSAAEYLTYVAAVGDNPESVEVRYEDENKTHYIMVLDKRKYYVSIN